MRVLMMTQRVDRNDDILGFTTKWVSELASHVEELHVLTGYAGTYDLPDNVTVYSYGKERGFSKPRRILRFERIAASMALLNRVDIVFTHMIADYVNGTFPWFKTMSIPYVLWFAHGTTNPRIRLAHQLVDRVVTPTEASFNLFSNKLTTVGHGIDMSEFSPDSTRRNRNQILGLGRLDPIKNFEIIIDAVAELSDRNRNITLKIVGGPADAEQAYADKLKQQAEALEIADQVEFTGPVPHTDVVDLYRRSGVFVNASQTGSLDKTEVEAMATETPVLSCNTSYVDMINDSELNENLAYDEPKSELLADRLEWILDLDDDRYRRIGQESRKVAKSRHGLREQMATIANILEATWKNS